MRRFPFIIIICLLTVSAATTIWAEGEALLCIRDYNSKKIVLKTPLACDQTFTIRYIHSVDRTPVFEVFKAKKGEGLVLKETYFRMFGAGMGHWEGHGKVVQEGEWIKIKDINQPLGSFILRVGSRGVDHTILINDHEWNLSQLAPGRRVEVMLSEE